MSQLKYALLYSTVLSQTLQRTALAQQVYRWFFFMESCHCVQSFTNTKGTAYRNYIAILTVALKKKKKACLHYILLLHLILWPAFISTSHPKLNLFILGHCTTCAPYANLWQCSTCLTFLSAPLWVNVPMFQCPQERSFSLHSLFHVSILVLVAHF